MLPVDFGGELGTINDLNGKSTNKPNNFAFTHF